MNLSDKSQLYFIIRACPDWNDSFLDIRSTENGAIDYLRDLQHWWSGTDCKVAVCQISGKEILERSVIIRRNELYKYPITIKQLFETGVPHTIELKAVPNE
ncbi:MAG: hypothetical protein PHI12_11370 [Dehalococcoidales bacterium]|nr:hypothetical protein [Dehalococcoidales bacterium]